MKARAAVVGFLAAILSAAVACERRAATSATPEAPATPSAPSAITAEKGPVKVTLAIEPGAPTLSDEPLFTMTIVTARDANATLPPLGSDPSNAGAFHVLDVREPPPTVDPTTGAKTLVRTCRLEPLESGDVAIAPITVTFKVDGDAADAEPHAITTEPLKFTITAPLAGAEASLERLKPPLAPDRLTVPHQIPWVWIAVSCGALAVGLLLFGWLLRRQRARALPPPTPQELARREFEALLANDPLARGELTTFYVELTAIVRRFVERTTGIRAPEQTTEEFLRACQARGALDRDTRERLVAFLEAADLVKFAAGRPAPDDIADSFRRAQAFVGLPGNLSLKASAPRLAEAGR